MYDCGAGIAQNKREAFKWFLKAAEQGNAEAQYFVGNCYSNGDGITENKKEAAKWYRKAAEQGDTKSQYLLGTMYFFGRGIVTDKYEGFKWIMKAAEQGFVNAQGMVGYCYEYGAGVSMNLNQAFSWYKKAADQGHLISITSLGSLYENGVVVPRDEGKAFSYYKQAAEKGEDLAQQMLSFCYYYGTGTPKDNRLAIYWMKKAKENGNKQAAECLDNLIKIVSLEENYPDSQSFGYGGTDNTITILMNKRDGIYYLPCKINGLKADFVFDTGAGAISLSSYFARCLIEQGLMSELDIKGRIQTRVADGRTSDALVANIKDVEIGGLHLYNVAAIIKEQQNAPLLLGQTAIEKLGKITIDGYKLIIHRE